MGYSLIIDKEYVVIKDCSKSIISISRDTMEPSGLDVKFSNEVEHQFLFVLGLYRVGNDYFLAVCTETEATSNLLDIKRVKSIEVFQISAGNTNNQSIETVRNSLTLTFLYYSDSADLSINRQQAKEGLASRSDYIWNYEAIQNFGNKYGASNMLKPVISGFIGSYECNNFKFILISRRNTKNVGTRFWKRGLNDEGYPANYVETEQIIEYNDSLYSFVQIRGSIPLKWSQYPNLSRLPPITIEKTENDDLSLTHFNMIKDQYGDLLCVCLTNSTGKEQPLTQGYEELCKRNSISYQYFDFHKECSKMHYENIQNLINSISAKLETFDFFGPGHMQKGVVRTNCIDNLDRTNVVQSKIAESNMFKILGKVEDMQFFRNIWTDNADALSIQYSGTDAMKTDYTRTGTRSIKGTLKDGYSAVKRYYVNTLKDGTRQDEYDLVTTGKQEVFPQKTNIIIAILLLLFYIVLYIVTKIIKKKKESKLYQDKISEIIIDKPHWPKLKKEY